MGQQYQHTHKETHRWRFLLLLHLWQFIPAVSTSNSEPSLPLLEHLGEAGVVSTKGDTHLLRGPSAELRADKPQD